jgi:uncharacterized integral membrane protein
MNIRTKRIILTIVLFLFIPQVYFVTDCPIRTAHCEDLLSIGLTYNVLWRSSVSIFKYGHWDYIFILIAHLLVALIIAYLISCFVFKEKIVRKRKIVKKREK